MSKRKFQTVMLTRLAAVLVLALASSGAAQAQLFGGDDEARRAILDLRAKVEALELKNQDEATNTRRQLLELSTELQQLRRELATLRGDNERLMHELGTIQRQTDERLKPFEPTIISMDGLEFRALPEESKAFDAAMAELRASQFKRAAELFANMRIRFPSTGYMGHALFWEGNAHYAARQYAPAVQSFERLVQTLPQHPKAAESLLSLASCHVELKDVRAARAALERLVKDYPNTEAAATARERLTRLR